MIYRGFRAGALPKLHLQGDRFTTFSKGKQIQGVMPQEALEAIHQAGLDPEQPFKDIPSALAVEGRVRRFTTKLYNKKVLAHIYSCHDFRHYFSVQDYLKHKDPLRLKELLFHDNLQTTDHYLRSLNLID
jgi:integrase